METLLFGIAESFIGKLASHAVQEAALALGFHDDLQAIRDTVSYIKAVLLDAELKQQQNHELQEWLRQVKRVFSYAEDIIDDFECEALRKHVVNTSGSIERKVRRFFSSSNPLVYRLRMAHEIKAVKEKLDKVAANRNNFGLQTIHNDNRVVPRRETHSRVNDSDVIGREHDKQKILHLLLQESHHDKGRLSVIPIVGIGGLGKTTLAKSVFNDKSTLSFSLKMWVCVSDDFDLKNVLAKILNSAILKNVLVKFLNSGVPNDSAPKPIHQQNFKNSNMEQIQNHVRNTLMGQKFLLVLDDVWNEDRVKWEELKDLIQVGAEGSTILVTTRSHIVANIMGTHSPQTLQGLSKEDSLSVFLRWAFKEGEEKKHPQLMEIAEDIVRKCGGLPLALRTLGGSLFGKVDIQRWMFVRDNEIWKLQQREDDILPAIKLSYDQLPSYLKRCFACFAFFEKDFEFLSFYVTMLWEALGFLPSSSEQGENVEDIGNRFLHELQSRSFLQDFIDYGSASKFKVHDLVHDLAQYVAKDEFQQVKSNVETISDNVLHLSLVKNDLLARIPIPKRLRLRTMLFPKGVKNEVSFKTLVSRCKNMRVLQLNNSGIESLHDSIGKLKHLRCLNLDHNQKLKRLPDSICKLQHLHTLTLPGCLKLQTLPNGIGNLVSLRQLHITTKQSSFPNKEISKLTSLEILSLYSCDNLESLFEEIQLPSLNFLEIISCENLKYLPLHNLPNLESLSIHDCDKLDLSMGCDNQIPKLRLKLLSLETLPQLVTFPQWLQGCANKLQSLRIIDCDNLFELPSWLSTLNFLKTLSIEDCPALLVLPDDLHCLPNLEYLKIESCPELCRRYQPEVGEDWPKISHIKQVSVVSLEPKK